MPNNQEKTNWLVGNFLRFTILLGQIRAAAYHPKVTLTSSCFSLKRSGVRLITNTTRRSVSMPTISKIFDEDPTFSTTESICAPIGKVERSLQVTKKDVTACRHVLLLTDGKNNTFILWCTRCCLARNKSASKVSNVPSIIPKKTGGKLIRALIWQKWQRDQSLKNCLRK